MTSTPHNHAAAFRPRGDRRFWRLHTVWPSEATCWVDLLAAAELRDYELRGTPAPARDHSTRQPAGVIPLTPRLDDKANGRGAWYTHTVKRAEPAEWLDPTGP